MKKILITGSEGYIGKNLCKYLEKKNYLIIKLDTNIKLVNRFNWKVDLLNLIIVLCVYIFCFIFLMRNLQQRHRPNIPKMGFLILAYKVGKLRPVVF